MAFNYREHLISGKSTEAIDWIQNSNLSADAKTKLIGFVKKFPTLTFYKNDDLILDRKEETEKVRFPAWFRELRITLAYILPDERDVHLKIGRCDHWSPRQDSIDTFWYYFGLVGFSNDEQREILQNELFPIGYCGNSTIAINLLSGATAVYEYCDQDLWDNKSEGTPPRASVYKIFDSIEDLFAQIIAFKLSDGTIVK